MFDKLTKPPAINPTKPRAKRNTFRTIRNWPNDEHFSSLQYVRLCIIGGAIKANVEELIEPTKLIKRSSFGIAAAIATKKEKMNSNYALIL